MTTRLTREKRGISHSSNMPTIKLPKARARPTSTFRRQRLATATLRISPEYAVQRCSGAAGTPALLSIVSGLWCDPVACAGLDKRDAAPPPPPGFPPPFRGGMSFLESGTFSRLLQRPAFSVSPSNHGMLEKKNAQKVQFDALGSLVPLRKSHCLCGANNPVISVAFFFSAALLTLLTSFNPPLQPKDVNGVGTVMSPQQPHTYLTHCPRQNKQKRQASTTNQPSHDRLCSSHLLDKT